MKTFIPISAAMRRASSWLTLLVTLASFAPGLRADIVICDNWGWNPPAKRNPPAGTQLGGVAAYVNDYNDATVVTILRDSPNSYGSVVFPGVQKLDGLNVSFGVDLHGDRAADGISFNYSLAGVNQGAAKSEKGDEAALAVQFIIDTYGQNNQGTLNIVYRSQTVVSQSIPFLYYQNRLPPSGRASALFSMSVTPAGMLTWSLQRRDANSASTNFVASYGSTVSLGTSNPLADFNGPAYFGARSGSGTVWGELDGINIRGYIYPALSSPPTSLAANQDQPSAATTLNLSSLDPTWPADNVIIQAYADNSVLIPPGNIQITGSGASRQLLFQGGTHQYGDTALNLLVTYPNSSWTNRYSIPVSIAQNIPPTLGGIPSTITLQQGHPLAIPFTYSTTQWSLSRQINVSAAETGTLGQPYSVHIVPPANIPDGPGTVDSVLTFTPKLNTSGNTSVQVTVTDGAGAQAVSTMNVTVVPQHQSPVVAGERTAISFNENGATGQFAEDTIGLGVLGGNFTIEAWVRPEALPNSLWNPIVSLGTPATAQFAMLALQNNGIPAFAGYGIDAKPASGPTAPLNGWSHIAVAVNGQTVQLYFNGQWFSTVVLAQPMNVQNGNFAIGFDEVNRNAFHGQIDEVRIWNVTRTATDIKNNFRSKVSPVSPGLVRYYDFDADFYNFTLPYGVIAYDSAATTRNLTLVNLPAYVPGVALDTVFNTPQNTALVLPLVAQNVQGTDWYGTAGALREAFIGSGGIDLHSATNTPDYPGNPYILTLLGDAVEIGPGGMVNGVERLRGYLLPPQTGNYTFWIASHFEGQLWVSTDDTPASKKLIASSPANGVSFRQWTANPSQKSAPVSLTAGRRYYFEVVHASLDAGQGNPTFVSLQWQLPDNTIESPLPAYRVQPPVPTAGTNGPLQIVITTPPANGSAGITNGVLTYNPRPYFFGQDDLFYYAVDAGRTSTPSHLVFQVRNINDRPVAGNNNALYFNGDSGRIQSDTSLSLSNRSFTLEAWAQRPDPTAREWIISQGSVSPNQGLLFGWEADSKFKFGFWANDLQMSTPFTDTNWHHWAATYDLPAGTRKIYLDGVLVAQDTTTNVLRTPATSPIHIASQFGAAPFFHGGISEVRVWDHARTAEELQQDMNIPLTGLEAGLMLYYRLNEGNGLTVNDTSMDPPYQLSVSGSIIGGITWTTNNLFFGTVTVPRSVGQPYIANQIYLPGFDPDGTQLSYYLVDGRTNGFATIPDAGQPLVRYTPNLYAKGGDILRYYVKNAAGVSSSIATLFISIATSNLPPTISAFLDQAVEEEDPPLTLTFVVADLDLPESSLTVTGLCSNPTLLPHSGFTFSGTDNIRTVTLNPADGEIGLGTVTITVSDGQRTASQQFKYQVKGRLAFAPVDIGVLTGQPYSEANGINAAGQVVGFTATDNQQSHPQGFVYTGFGPLAQVLPAGTLGGDGSKLNGINKAGKSVGWAITATGNATNVIVAEPGPPVTLTSRGTMVGGATSLAIAINDAGDFTGYGDVGGGVPHAFYAAPNGDLVDIKVPAGAVQSLGMAINNSQTIAGYAIDSKGIANGFLYDIGTSNFTMLTGPNGTTGAIATSINDANDVGGYIFTNARVHAAIAFDTTWTDLGDVFGGGAARINDLNLLRQAVGTARDTNGNWRAFYYENGRTYDLNALLPLNSGWTLVDARAINDQAQIVGVGQKEGQTRAFLLFPASEIGRRVFRPPGTLPTMPQVTLIQGNPGDNALTSFFWSDNDQKLFAIRPVAALVNWHTGRYTTYTNETQFGDSVIRQVFTNEVMIASFSYNVWPKDANIQVASCPVELEPPFPGFGFSFVEMIYSTVDGAGVDQNKSFDTPFGSTGYSVFRYLISNGRAPNPQLQKVKFNVARTTSWDDPEFLETNLTATVGVPLTNAAHDDYPGRNGWMVFTNAYYDGAGPTAAYVRTNRGGNIIPVNAVTNRDDFVVAWYNRDLLGVAWPSLPKKYKLQWPTNAPHLIIASTKGSGSIDFTLYPNAQIYNQPDVTQPGFNPNEEHALFAPDLSRGGTVLFALRCDLNQARPGIPSDSEPFVLLKYQDPATQLWGFHTFQVVAEEDPYYFTYEGIAGTQIQPPYPLSLLPQSSSSYAASGPAWQDYAGRFYALAGGERLNKSSVVMRYYYPLQPGFWYDLNNDGTNDLPVGVSVPWLSQLSPDQDLNQPVDTTYEIGWPGDLPTLAIGESLYGAAHGLPDVQDMASVQIAYDSLASVLASEGIQGVTQLARLFDPMTPRMVTVPGTSVFANINLSTPDSSTGFQTFPDLPFFLRTRLYYDPVARKLCFQGFVQPQTVGQPLTLINVMSERERIRIQQLDGTNGATAFDTLVQKLYVMTRNPNQLDIQPRNGQPDNALYIGLTYDATGTNVTFEQLGSEPKGLTAGIPQFNSQLADGQWLNFNGGVPGTSVELGRTNAFANVTNNFTIEFWARPTLGRSSSAETDNGIQSAAHVAGRFAIIPNQGDQAYGEGHATAGISIGTNGVSVFQHTYNYLPTPLVYEALITNWTHVAISYANATPSLYLNGNLVRVGLPTATNVVSFVHPGIGIGGAQGRTDFGYYGGDLDEVRVWNFPVSQSQIQSRMFQQLSGYERGLVGYWPMNEGRGTNLVDHSTNHLNGVVWNNNSIDDSSWVAGAGPVFVTPRYQVLVENNDPSLPGQPVTLHLIQVGTGPYQGSIQTILPDNVLDQRVTLRHSADFGGDPRQLEFQWYYYPAEGGATPPLPDASNPTANGWVPFPDSGPGVNDITTGEGNLSSLITMSDNWFIMRYRGYVIDGATNWSPWVGDASSTTTTRPMLVEGWIKRVLAGVNLFNQRESDFASFHVNTLVSSIAQAGARYEGDIALNPGALDTPGLIQIYQTVLNRGESLSVKGTPPVDYDPANQALLLAAGHISDLYMLLGNEASADAADPTIGLNPPLPDGGSLAASMFAFENQVNSLLDEELGLLRGRDDSSAGVGAAPVYNRLFWNFTGGNGEVAYVATYNLSDYNGDGFINATDAAILYPQGHGDAWGHYLTALTSYYGLLQNTNFTWIPQTEDVVLGGVTLEVGYLHERNFAGAAAARAQTGAKILDRTYRSEYSTTPTGLWAGYKDVNLQRAWGTTEWGWRAGSGAYFDWLAGNAILPAVDTNHTGIEKIDRTTVPELGQVANAAIQIQTTLDSADSGYNPLGLSPNAVPFDLDPTLLLMDFFRQTHFDQIYNRALASLQNAVTTFKQASQLTDALRTQADNESNFGAAVELQELAYRNQLIGLFGYPYSGDIGPNAPNPSGYVGPDLYHWMYIDATEVTPQNNSPGANFTALYKPFQDAADKWGFQFAPDITNALAANPNSLLEVNYPVATDSYLFQAPLTWGRRRAEGALQSTLRNMVQAKASYQQALNAYNQHVTSISGQLDTLEARYDLSATKIRILNSKLITQSTMNTAILGAKAVHLAAEQFGTLVQKVEESIVAAMPVVEGLAIDAAAPLRGLAVTGTITPEATLGSLKNAATLLEAGFDFAKEEANLVLDTEGEKDQISAELKEAVKQLQSSVRAEYGLRLSLFQQAESLQQAVQTYLSTLAQAQQALEQRLIYRQLTAGSVAEMRYRDLAFRIFRNDALEQYDTQFSLAARYVFLAAKAFDYEVNLDDAGATDLALSVVSERNLGQVQDGVPSASRNGLASSLAKLKQNFDVLKPRLGLNNTHDERAQFSLRSEWQRITNSASWLALLQNSAVSNLWDVPEFLQYCRPFAPEGAGPQPGLVISIPGTTITSGQNFFGRPLAAQDYSYDPSQFSTRIRSVAVWFTGYDGTLLARAPRVYLIPVGADILRSPNALDFSPRSWQVVEQRIPIPFPVSSITASSLVTDTLNLKDQFADWARHSAFQAYPDTGYDPNNFNPSTRLVGRSVANTRWLLVIPGAYLNGDPNQGLADFIHSVTDIKLYFQTYSASGN
jgi:hypothetical protein